MIFEKIKKLNYLFLFIILIISTIGFLALFSASNGSLDPWAKKQIIRFIICFVLLISISLIDIKILYKYTYIIFFLSFLLLASVEIAGTFGLGAKRWIRIFGISIQPSELIKITIILALSKYYHNLKFENIGKVISVVFPLIVILSSCAFVLIQPDLGTTIIILLLGTIIMFVAGTKIWKFVLSLLVFLISLPIFWNNLKPYQHKRVLSFLDPESDPLGAGYHSIQSKIAIGSGGFWGKGLFAGTQSRLNFLPEKHTDFIFSVFAEETGFFGVILLISLFTFIILKGLNIAFRAADRFGFFLSLGLIISIAFYIIFNIGMTVGIFPITGIPLPFVSYGGSSLITNYFAVGLLLNVEMRRTLH